MSFFDRFFGPPTQATFAKQFIRELARLGHRGPIEFNEKDFVLRLGKDHQISLGNLYQEHCQIPRRERAAHRKRLASAMVSKKTLPEDFADARANLRPKLYLRATFENLSLQARIEGREPLKLPLYPVGEHMYSTLVYDRPDLMQSLRSEDFEEWGVTYYEAMETALENLVRTTVAHARIGEGVYSFVVNDNYDSSRLLLVDLIRKFEVRGQHVAVVPQRDQILITGSDDQEGLRILAEVTRKIVEELPRPLSPMPLMLVDGEWEDWFPPRSHPSYTAFNNLRQGCMYQLYEEQKPLLEALFEKAQQDVFVASFTGIKQPGTDQVTSSCVWIKDLLDCLLPRTELLQLLVPETEAVTTGDWDKVLAVAGNLLVPDPDFYPVRYRPIGFPTAEQLASIGPEKAK